MTSDIRVISAGVLFLFAIFLPNASAVQCYVCAWGPFDNQSDTCTPTHFDKSRVRTHDCPLGCEAITIYDKNDEMDIFYRNCVKRSSPKITNDCRKETSKSYTEEICTCDTDLCNTSYRNILHWGALFLTVIGVMCSSGFSFS